MRPAIFFFLCLPLLLGGCSLFLPAGEVPQGSIVDPPGSRKAAASDPENQLAASLRMKFVMLGLNGTIPCVYLDPSVSASFRRKLEQTGTLQSADASAPYRLHTEIKPETYRMELRERDSVIFRKEIPLRQNEEKRP